MTSVHVIYHHEPDGWWADSSQVPGWTAAAENLDELRGLVEEGVRFALETDEVLVEHRLEVGPTADIVYDFIAGETRTSTRVLVAAAC